MSSQSREPGPQPQAVNVPTELVIEVLRDQLAAANWQATLLEARARQAEAVAADLMAQRDQQVG